jgi:hypothetical protein
VRGRGGLRPARREAARLSRPLGRSPHIANTIESPSRCTSPLRSSVTQPLDCRQCIFGRHAWKVAALL